MVTLSTTESFPIPFTKLTLTPRPLDKLPLMLNKLPMSGETDGLPIPDQSTHMDLLNIELTQMVTLITMEFFPTLS